VSIKGERDFVASFIEGVRLLSDTVGAMGIPRGGRLVVLIGAGVAFPGEERVNMQITCNAGDTGLLDIIKQLEELRRTKTQ
jgi:hypothetical protein